jgi:hypothetical protein
LLDARIASDPDAWLVVLARVIGSRIGADMPWLDAASLSSAFGPIDAIVDSPCKIIIVEDNAIEQCGIQLGPSSFLPVSIDASEEGQGRDHSGKMPPVHG